MSNYHYLIATDGWATGNSDSSSSLRLLVNMPVDDSSTDFAEFRDFWPDLNDLPDGRDIFAGVFPVSGEPEPDVAG